MAGTIPKSISDSIAYAQEQVTQWTGKESQIGLTAIEVTELGSRATAAATSLVAQSAAKAAAKSATVTLHNDADYMRDYLGHCIGKIRAYAEASAFPSTVYAKAQIPPPAAPTPSGPPVDATDVSAEITHAGWVSLTWSGSVARNQFFSVWRQLPGESAFTQLGAIRAKSFVDSSVPVGKAYANYVIKAHRGTQVTGGTAPVSVLFGAESLAA